MSDMQVVIDLVHEIDDLKASVETLEMDLLGTERLLDREREMHKASFTSMQQAWDSANKATIERNQAVADRNFWKEEAKRMEDEADEHARKSDLDKRFVNVVTNTFGSAEFFMLAMRVYGMRRPTASTMIVLAHAFTPNGLAAARDSVWPITE